MSGQKLRFPGSLASLSTGYLKRWMDEVVHNIQDRRTGKRLFGAGAAPATLRLVSSSTTSKGAIVSVYRPAPGASRPARLLSIETLV